MRRSGRTLNRVVEWNRDSITIEADQRHVREILKGLELERANRSATPCAVERKDEGKGERADVDRGRPRLGTSGTSRTTVTTGTDRRWRTTMTPTAKHSQMVTSHSTEHSWHEPVTCRRIDQTSSSRQCRYVVRWQSQRCATWNASRGLLDTSLGSRWQGAGSAGSRVVSWRHTQMLTGEATRPLKDPCRRGSS